MLPRNTLHQGIPQLGQLQFQQELEAQVGHRPPLRHSGKPQTRTLRQPLRCQCCNTMQQLLNPCLANVEGPYTPELKLISPTTLFCVISVGYHPELRVPNFFY